MTTAFVVLTPRKPPEGAPCNGCGMCCIADPCILSDRFGLVTEDHRCRALEWSMTEHRYYCGLVTRPFAYLPPGCVSLGLEERLSRMFREALGDGTCDSRGGGSV